MEMKARRRKVETEGEKHHEEKEIVQAVMPGKVRWKTCSSEDG
jgi:hypothetical protein